MVQQPLEESRHWHREHRRGLQERPQADAVTRSYLRRDAAQARPRQDALPQDRQCQQSLGLHRVQR